MEGEEVGCDEGNVLYDVQGNSISSDLGCRGLSFMKVVCLA